MSQRLTQIQAQKTEQQLRLSQQQLQLVRLLEMPIAEFEQQVKKELMDNPALEEGAPEERDNVRDSADEMENNDTGIDPYGDMESGFLICQHTVTMICRSMLHPVERQNATSCLWVIVALSSSIWSRRW